MLTALADVSGYEAARNLSDSDILAIGDLNNDGRLDNADAQMLLVAIAGGGSGSLAAVPEPPGVLLAILAIKGLAVLARHGLRM